MGKRVTGESSEKKEDHPQENLVRNTNNTDGVTESSVNCDSLTEDDKVTGTDTTPPQPTMAEDAEEYIKPIIKDGEVILEVECGQNKALLYLSKLCQGSKGPCIYFQGSWLAPNEFQYVSGRETAKDWKRSIRHHGKSLKLLLAKGILSVHPTVCDCEGCRTGSTLNRNRNGTKKKTPANKEGKTKQTETSQGLNSPDTVKTTSLSTVPESDTNKKDVKKSKSKSSDKPLSPLKESKSTNIMNSTTVPNIPIPEEHVSRAPVVVSFSDVRSCPFPVAKIRAVSPVKLEARESISSLPQYQNDKLLNAETPKVKLEPVSEVQTLTAKLPLSKPTTVEAKRPCSPVTKQNNKVCVNNDDKSHNDASQKTKSFEILHDTKHHKIENSKSSFEMVKSKERSTSKSPHQENDRKISEHESEKIIPKSIPGYTPRISDAPAFRLPESYPDASMYADYMRLFASGHTLSQVPQPVDPLYNLRASDPPFNHVLHPYHGCAMYNAHSTGLYPTDPVLFPVPGTMAQSIGAPCFSPMHMFSQRLPYTLSSPVMELPRPYGFFPTPSSMSYPCSSISGIKRYHSELESSTDVVSKRLRLDYPMPDFRFDSYPSCSTSYPPLFYDTNLFQSEEYRRNRLEESMNCSKDIPSYYNGYISSKGGYPCICGTKAGDIRNWSVEDVYSFISRLDGCSLYAETFREQRVDGKILPLLTTDHMMKSLGVKLGPSVLIAEAVAKKDQEARLGVCDECRKLSQGTAAVTI